MTNPYGSQKILHHPDKLEELRDREVTAPIYVRIKPTNKCRHHCFYCSYEPGIKNILSETINRNDEIPKEKMMEILQDFKDMGVKAITYSGGGEPLDYPYIKEALKRTAGYGIEQSVITNGQELKGGIAEILADSEWVRISADSPDREIYLKTRRVPKKWFDEISENISEFSKIKKLDCELGVNYVVTHLNKDKIYEAAKYFKELGVNNIRFYPRWKDEGFEEYHAEFKQKVLDQIKQSGELNEKSYDNRFVVFDKYSGTFDFDSSKQRPYERCCVPETVPVIAADCNVYDCHDRAYVDKGKIGSIKEQSFKNLWFSKETAERFKNFNPKKECKHHCSFDERNLFIEDLLNGKVDPLIIIREMQSSPIHINFI